MHRLIRPFTQLLGVLFVLLGIYGIFHVGTFLIFEVNLVNSIVHLVTGIVALWAAVDGRERLFLLAFGCAYALIAAVGFIDEGDIYGYFRAGTAENTFYLALAVVAILVAASRKK